MHRRGISTTQERQVKTIMSKTTWYKRKRTEDDEEEKKRTHEGSPNKKRKIGRTEQPNLFEQPAVILFIQRTEGGKLASKFREMGGELFKITAGKINVVERNGRKLEEYLIRKNPWASDPCTRPDCTVCNQEEQPRNPQCKRQNLTYINTCLLCKNKGKKTVYIGESCRSLAERHREHVEDWLADKEESHMAAHSREAHNGQSSYQVKPLKLHRSAFTRHISETVQIKVQSLAGVHLMN